MVSSCNMRCLKSNSIPLAKKSLFQSKAFFNYFSLPTVASSDLCNQWPFWLTALTLNIQKYGFAEEKPLKTTKYVPQIQ